MNSRFLRKKAYVRPRDQDLEYDHESAGLLSAEGNDSDNEMSLHGRNFTLRPKQPISHCVEHTLQTGDTLSSLALRYNCSVAQIKQANNILRDNEVFALRKVRIPVSAFSSWRDNVPGVHSSHVNPKKISEQYQAEGPTSIITNESNWLENSATSQSDEELHDPLLTPIPLPRTPLVDLDTEPPDLELPQPPSKKKVSDGLFNCSGADCGISWIALVVCTLVLGFLGPLVYIFFLYEHEQERKMHNHTST